MIKEIIKQAESLNTNDLKTLLTQLIEVHNDRQRKERRRTIASLKKGDRVKVDGGKKCKSSNGTVVKINKTRCIVHIDGDAEFQNWTVPGELLTKID